MRLRDRWFCERVIELCAELGGFSDDVLYHAVNRTYHRGSSVMDWDRRSALKKARRKLLQPDVQSAIRDVYEGAAGFSIVDALQLHVKHIQGYAIEDTVTDDEGTESIRRTQVAPNYAALKDYLAMATPKAATRIESKSVNVNVSAPPARIGAPLMSPRLLTVKPLKEEES